MRSKFMRASADTLETVYFLQDNAESLAGFTGTAQDANVTSASTGTSGSYFYLEHLTNDANAGSFTIQMLAALVLPSATKPINAGDTMRISFDCQWYNSAAFNTNCNGFLQQFTLRAYSSTPSGITDTANSTTIQSYSASNVSISSLVSPIGVRSYDFVVPSGYEAGFRIYFNYQTAEAPITLTNYGASNPYIGTMVKDTKLEVISRA